MTFKEAVEEMIILAEGGVWALQYEVASYFEDCQIKGYIARRGGLADAANTYEQAIENVKKMVGMRIPIKGDLAPEDKEEPNG
jgi:hypothetical protein